MARLLNRGPRIFVGNRPDPLLLWHSPPSVVLAERTCRKPIPGRAGPPGSLTSLSRENHPRTRNCPGFPKFDASLPIEE